MKLSSLPRQIQKILDPLRSRPSWLRNPSIQQMSLFSVVASMDPSHQHFLGDLLASRIFTSISKLSLSRKVLKSGSPTSIGCKTIFVRAACRAHRLFSTNSDPKRPGHVYQPFSGSTGSHLTQGALFWHSWNQYTGIVGYQCFI